MSALDTLEKIILLLYGVDGKPFLTKFKFQKAVFLSILSLASDRKKIYDYLDAISFYPHKYGPYSEEVDQKKTDLLRKGVLVKKNDKEIISEHGKRIFNQICRKMDKKKLTILQSIKELVNVDVPDKILALLIYDIAEKYGYTRNSKILSELYKNRVDYALILYEKGVISRERAAELARMDPISFSELLMRRESAYHGQESNAYA